MKTLMGTTLNTEETEVFNSVNQKFRNSTQTAEATSSLVPKQLKKKLEKNKNASYFADVHESFC